MELGGPFTRGPLDFAHPITTPLSVGITGPQCVQPFCRAQARDTDSTHHTIQKTGSPVAVRISYIWCGLKRIEDRGMKAGQQDRQQNKGRTMTVTVTLTLTSDIATRGTRWSEFVKSHINQLRLLTAQLWIAGKLACLCSHDQSLASVGVCVCHLHDCSKRASRHKILFLASSCAPNITQNSCNHSVQLLC